MPLLSVPVFVVHFTGKPHQCDPPAKWRLASTILPVPEGTRQGPVALINTAYPAHLQPSASGWGYNTDHGDTTQTTNRQVRHAGPTDPILASLANQS